MQAIEIIVIAAAILFVAAVVFGSLYRRKKSKNSAKCPTGCAGCPFADSCRSGKNAKKK